MYVPRCVCRFVCTYAYLQEQSHRYYFVVDAILFVRLIIYFSVNSVPAITEQFDFKT